MRGAYPASGWRGKGCSPGKGPAPQLLDEELAAILHRFHFRRLPGAMFMPGSLLLHCGGNRRQVVACNPLLSPCLQRPSQEGGHHECCKTQSSQKLRSWGSLAPTHPASPASQDPELTHGQELPPLTSWVTAPTSPLTPYFPTCWLKRWHSKLGLPRAPPHSALSPLRTLQRCPLRSSHPGSFFRTPPTCLTLRLALK